MYWRTEDYSIFVGVALYLFLNVYAHGKVETSTYVNAVKV